MVSDADADDAGDSDASTDRFADVFAAETFLPPFVRGITAFVVGLVALMAVVLVVSQDFNIGSVPEFVRDMSFLFYSAHNVSITARFGPPYNSLVVIAQMGLADFPVRTFFALPVVVLTVAGAELARGRFDATTDPATIGRDVLLFAAGYGATSLIGSFIFRSGPSHPSHVRALLFGLAYPVVFVFVGVLAVQVWRRRSE